MLRCTAKVLALLRVSEPAIGQVGQQDWYAHLVWIDRRKCRLVNHASTSFSVFMPNVTAAGLRPIGPPVVSAIQSALQAEHLPVDTLGELDPQQVAVAKSAVRAARRADGNSDELIRDAALRKSIAPAQDGKSRTIELSDSDPVTRPGMAQCRRGRWLLTAS